MRVLVSRDGEARARVIADVSGETLRQNVRDNVERTATLYSDEWPAYKALGREFNGHHVTKHSDGVYAPPPACVLGLGYGWRAGISTSSRSWAFAGAAVARRLGTQQLPTKDRLPAEGFAL